MPLDSISGTIGHDIHRVTPKLILPPILFGWDLQQLTEPPQWGPDEVAGVIRSVYLLEGQDQAKKIFCSQPEESFFCGIGRYIILWLLLHTGIFLTPDCSP